ncbi:MAG: hypothetical protein U1E65_07050 [Myxococcota bacterium]
MLRTPTQRAATELFQGTNLSTIQLGVSKKRVADEIHDILDRAQIRSHHAEPQVSVHTLMDRLRDSPGARAVLIGTGGLGTFMGVVGTAQAAPVNTTAAASTAPRSIVYLGMNKDSSYEIASLKNVVGEAGVTYLSTAKTADSIAYKGQTYDLTKPEGCLAYAKALGLPDDRAQALATVLSDTGEGARDEAAQLARIFREAETGKRTIERIVFSGHSIGSVIWGDGNGMLQFTTIGKLALVFPKAAAQVEDLMIAACYSGGESNMENYRAMFPNLKTAWAYDGSAPGSVSGAIPHILRWEKATRGPTADALKRTLAEGTRKGENVAVWTVTKGYNNGQPQMSLEDARKAWADGKDIVAGFQSGATVVDDPQSGPLRQHYNAIQRMLGRSDLPADERASLSTERDQVIRLLFYKNVGTMFQATYGSSISSAFAELGLPKPDFGTLSRKDALATIQSFDAKLSAAEKPSAATKALATRLHEGLVNLSPSAIPTAWL